MAASSDDWVELSQDFLHRQRDQFKHVNDWYGSAKHWSRGNTTLHLHYSMSSPPTYDSTFYDGCAQLESMGPGQQVPKLDQPATLNLCREVTRRGCHKGRDDHAVLVHIRESPKPSHGFAAVPATVRLVSLYDCPVWLYWNARQSTAKITVVGSSQLRPGLRHGPLDVPSFPYRQPSTTSTSNQQPGELIEGRSEILDTISNQETTIIANHREASDRGGKTTACFVKVHIHGYRVDVRVTRSIKAGLQRIEVMFAPPELGSAPL